MLKWHAENFRKAFVCTLTDDGGRYVGEIAASRIAELLEAADAAQARIAELEAAVSLQEDRRIELAHQLAQALGRVGELEGALSLHEVKRTSLVVPFQGLEGKTLTGTLRELIDDAKHGRPALPGIREET